MKIDDVRVFDFIISQYKNNKRRIGYAYPIEKAMHTVMKKNNGVLSFGLNEPNKWQPHIQEKIKMAMNKKNYVIEGKKASDIIGNCMLIKFDERKKFDDGKAIEGEFNHYAIVLPDNETETLEVLIESDLPKDYKTRSDIDFGEFCLTIKPKGTGSYNGRFLAELNITATAKRVLPAQK